MTQLEPLIAEVVRLRQGEALSQDILRQLRAAWEAENADLLLEVKQLQDKLDAAENSLRGEALLHYAATGNKQVAPGVVIRVNTEAVYDVKAATAWSLGHGAIAHAFDPKLFKALAKTGAVPSGIVKFEDIPSATLAKDLPSPSL